ncbi:MAG: ribonuclease III [SAR324 cluster bacterium]|nr:ribonuclease III [SAR324 cluster bacterium]
MDSNLKHLCEQIDYQFKDRSLLQQACTHKSYANEQVKDCQDNERLEFLGDAVLDLVISDLLMELFPELPEGGLTKLRASLVSETGLSKIAKSIDLGNCLMLGRGEELTGGRHKKSILSSSLEALIAAIYIDSQKGDLGEVRAVIWHLFQNEFPDNVASFFSHDYKTDLQEFVQKKFGTTTTYKLLNAYGPDHQKQFEVIAVIGNKQYGAGQGTSKKQAEQFAAQEALSLLLKMDTNEEKN